MFVIFLEAYLWTGLVVLAAIILFGGRARREHAERIKECATYIRPELRAQLCRPRPIKDTLEWIAGGLIVVTSWPGLVVWGGWTLLKRIHNAFGPAKRVPPWQDQFDIELEHLVEKFSLEEIEKLEAVIDPLDAAPALPFGVLNSRWREFLSARSADTELWSFRAYRAGEYLRWEEVRGYAAVRDEAVVEGYFVAESRRASTDS